MLRNLRTQRFLGTPFRGIKGAAIPSTGTHGASVMYDDIDPVAEANDEFRFRLSSAPAGFFMYEDGSFIFAPVSDGTYTATGVLMKNGADVGPETITLQSGVAGITVSAGIGAAAASAAAATIQQGRTISCSLGLARAQGSAAPIQSGGAGGTTSVIASQVSAARTVVFPSAVRVVVFV